MPQSTVVITGVGVVSSIGIGGDAYFDALMAKKSGITSLADRTDEGAKPPPSDPDGQFAAQPAGLWIGGPIVDFDPKQYVRPRKALKVMCREIQTSFAASQIAVDHAGLADVFPVSPQPEPNRAEPNQPVPNQTVPNQTGQIASAEPATDDAAAAGLRTGPAPAPLLPADVGTVFGSEMFYGPASEIEDAMRLCIKEDGSFDTANFGAAAMKQVLPLWMLKYLPNMPACHVGIALGAHGPNNTLVLGEVSGPAAMIEAVGCLRRGIARVMIAGGVGTRINTTRMNYRGDLPIANVFDPVHLSSRPYDPQSRGIVGGEAAASIVLEDAESAASRGAPIVARIVSYASRFVPSGGMNLAMRSSTNSEPKIRGSAQAIELAIRGALESAGLSAAEIGLVVGHGTGDPIMDKAETDAVKAVLADVPLMAPTGALGHTGAACGAIGVVTGALVISKGMIPPTLGADSDGTDPSVVQSAQKLQQDYVLCLSHTSEGSAVAIILGKS
ncbi:3-oxoacyl-[acyl-carrier-protein] synthase 2 [Rubripirellula lacrimiformis]|uniref:3-oxoacyl-[acyl-carrier-protein] synthase 2 n=1 Tax=Rubripirellula lacrimiformis TaxID=1930273 RepID=A0A517N6S1_9BACT|nr:beta-ketoacyl synthase N-terminal-like domain-containing protein [Rubripirellula lacrimiformis]QDT02849.1 3-oxoacyl-[acyl-carrier-protein] synthase 2 [Rubripirellula lacrimiformis]